MRLFSRLRDPELSNIVIYGIATGLAAVLILVQTRVLWRALTPADFGVWALLDPVLIPVASIVLFGIDHAIVKQLRVDHLPLRVVTGNLLVTTLPAAALCLLVIGIIFHLSFHSGWTTALLLTVAGEALMLMMQTAFRATGAVRLFAALLLSRNLLYLVLLLGIQANSGMVSLSVGLVFLTRGGCVMLVGMAAVAALRPVPRIDWARYRDALHYGFPLLLTTVIYAVTDMTDRWFLADFTGVVAVGVYALHLKVAAILSQAIVIPFGLWFPPERFKRINDVDEGRSFFIATATVLALICGYLSGCVWLARDLVLSLIAPGIVASPLILACCLAAVTCLALSHAFNVGLLMPGHTRKNAICTVYTITATVLAAGILVPLFGMNGAAVSRLFGGLVLVGVTAVWSNRVFPIAFPFATILAYFAASAAAAAALNRAATGHGLKGLAVALVAWTAVTLLFAALWWTRLRPARGVRSRPFRRQSGRQG
ncbi:lipopolysaccharide biosynthesis protein [Rhodopila sp.]|uniref:lipopolysaccharide biosynthesis protein n=1 Tax=Rhodopila sp. TaxID=2480087 RepID=UPI003D0F6B92